jgi:cell division protein FtsQ
VSASAPIRAPEVSRFLRREGNLLVRRERRTQWLSRALLRIAIVSGAIGITALGLREAASWAVTTPLLAASRIEVEGNRHADVESLRALAQGAIQGNLLGADLDRVAAAVRDHPWVRHVQVQRRLPRTLTVRVEERTPCALLLLAGEAFLIDTSGARIDRYQPSYAAWSFPVLRGLDEVPTAERLSRCRGAASQLAALQSGSPEVYARLAEVDLSDPAATVLSVEGIPERLEAAPGEWTRNLESYLALRPQLLDRHVAVTTVDLRWTGRLAVVPDPRAVEEEEKHPKQAGARPRPRAI